MATRGSPRPSDEGEVVGTATSSDCPAALERREPSLSDNGELVRDASHSFISASPTGPPCQRLYWRSGETEHAVTGGFGPAQVMCELVTGPKDEIRPGLAGGKRGAWLSER